MHAARAVNFLVHLHLSDAAQLPLSGAILGDLVRGRLEGRFPAALEQSIRLHRRIDVVTDAHPLTHAARARFPAERRRYAGIVLDLLYDHCMALDWPREDTLAAFAHQAAAGVADDHEAWRLTDQTPPSRERFERLLSSYREPIGIDQSLTRIATRLRNPELLLAAADRWQAHIPLLRQEFPALLLDLEQATRAFAAPV